MKKLLMGNEAMAMAAIAAGVNVVCGYPGTPSSEVLETIAKNNPGNIYVEWSVNEKVAMELAAGAAYSGARALVTMKQVGLNVASDPLMSIAYVGVKGGMVVLAADDPGPISSQTEQDTRHFAKFANLPVFDPSTPEEAYEMMLDAFELSEKAGLPVFMRPTTRICHACSVVDVEEMNFEHKAEGFVKDSKWVIFPALSYRNHIKNEVLQKEIGQTFDHSVYNEIDGKGNIGIVAGGVSVAYAKEALADLGLTTRVKFLKLGNPYPFPEGIAEYFLKGLDNVLVLEELDAFLEDELLRLCGKRHLNVDVFGKNTGHMPVAGENSLAIVKAAIAGFAGIELPKQEELVLPALPVRPPVLCAGCPHRGAFYAVKKAMQGTSAVFTGDIGCYTLGNAKPLDMVDTCLCMGAGITVAQGIARAKNPAKHIAFIGDSTFFHSGITGLINAAYNKTDITMVILDNSTTAMTGHQPHPGIGRTMMGEISAKIDLKALVSASGIQKTFELDPFDLEKALPAIREAVNYEGPSVIIFKAPCIALFKPAKIYKINNKCTKCQKCIRELGCPAITFDAVAKTVQIEPTLCYGCDLCAQVCPVDAIEVAGGEANA
ncbi:MAG: indolepyruvate ferredoxin oxidoreductase subunit alpha [Clostridia bacterium]|nr:indolepyruvate ferredoxin oxidoreductase subunit alpha [Clostridia bacterium]